MQGKNRSRKTPRTEGNMTAVRFKCQDCNKEIQVSHATLEKEGVMLIGNCHDCQVTWQIPVDNLITALYGANPVKGNGKVN